MSKVADRAAAAARLKQRTAKALRVRDKKTIHDLARELETTRNHLARPVRELCDEGLAVRHEGRPPSYSKAKQG